jgi:hypothetical protein
MSTTSEKSSKYFPIRRSTRLPLEIPVRVSSVDPKVKFAQDCTTVTVSAHGCGVISPGQLASGTRVELEIVADKKKAVAKVLEVVPLNDEKTSWLLGMELEHPGNFWGIKYAPADWAEEEPEPAASTTSTTAAAVIKAPPVKAAAPVKPTQPLQSPVGAPSKPASLGSSAKLDAPATPPKPATPGLVAKPAAAAPAKPVPTAMKEIPTAVLRRLLSECRLAAISVGACYVQTGTTFPMHAPVKLVVQTEAKEHAFPGTVRVEHVGAGMGIEFSGSGDEHGERIAELIEALSAQGDNIPKVRLELAAPDKKTPPKSKSASVAAAQYDSLLGLVLVGGSLKRSDFLRELEKQRRRG